MSRLLKQSTAVTLRVGPYLDSTDGVTAETALTPTFQLSKAGGAFAARGDATAPAHDADGWYSAVLNATDTGTVGPLLIKSVVAGALPVWHELTVLPALVYDSLVAGTDQLQVDLIQWLGVAPLALVSQRVNASVGAMAAGTVTATAMATDAIGAAQLAATAIAEIADGVLDEPMSGHLTAGTLGQVLQVARSGTAQAGGAQTITLDAGASAVNDFYFAGRVNITSGTGAGQSRIIRDYVGATKVASVTIPWFTQPDATSVFVVTFEQSIWDELRADHIITGSFGEGVIVAANGLSGASIAANAISAAKIATGAIDADALTADAVAEIADGVWDEPIAGHLGAGSTGAALNGATAPSAAVVADAVWDEQLAGHLGVGSTGEKLNAAGAAGDPWTTALPGAYGVGTAGNIVGNMVTNIWANATRTLTSFGTVVADTAAAVWNALLASFNTPGTFGAKVNSLTNVTSPSAVSFTYTLTRSDNAQPIDDAQVDVYADAGLTTLVTSGRTDAFGVVKFFLDPGTYRLVRTKSGFVFVNPDVEVVV